MSDEAPEHQADHVSPDSTGDLDPATLAHRAIDSSVLGRDGSYQVVFAQSALNRLHRHGQSDLEAEICGVLVGQVFRDDAGPYLLVQDIVRGENATGSAAQVTFTSETWSHIHDVMDRDFPLLRIVGWYHTHPGFGIFLSEMDLFLHGNFFNLPWQIAFVYDPRSLEDGLFIWEDGQTQRRAPLVEADEPAVSFKPTRTGKRKPPAREKPAVVLEAPSAPLLSQATSTGSDNPSVRKSSIFLRPANTTPTAILNNADTADNRVPGRQSSVTVPHGLGYWWLWALTAVLAGFLLGVESMRWNVDTIQWMKDAIARLTALF